MSQTAFDLFDATPQGLRTVDSPAVGFSHRNADKNETRAAKKQVRNGGAVRRKVLDEIVASGKRGLTRQEVSDQTGVPLQSVCARVKECLDEGWLFKTYRSRDGRGVLIATDRGIRASRHLTVEGKTCATSQALTHPANPAKAPARLSSPLEGA